MRKRVGLMLVAGAGMLVAACGQGGQRTRESSPMVGSDAAGLLAILASTSTPDASRKAADQRLVEVKGKTDASRLALLEQLLYAPGHSDAMRIYAMDRLVEADAARAGQALLMYVPRMEGAVLEHACEVAITLGDLRVQDALIRSLGRAAEGKAAAIKDRPEWKALEKLAGRPVAQTLYSVMEKNVNGAVRVAALDILQAALGEKETIAGVRKLSGNGPAGWLGDVKWWAGEFGSLPRGENESAWVHLMAQPGQAEMLAKARIRHQGLVGHADYLFAPRFVFALAMVDDRTVGLGREELVASLKKKLERLEHVHRPPAYPGSPEDVNDTLAGNLKKLSRGDLLTIELLLTHVGEAGFEAELQRQGLADLSDTQTEHGGLLVMENDHLAAREYPGMFSNTDFQYVAGDKLTRETVTGLAQYHLHFQEVHNAQRAGPSPGDLEYARAGRMNAVVVTSVDTRKVNLDYYTPGGAVVDLGTYVVGE